MICDKLQRVERGEITRLILTLPPRHGKSFTVSESFPSWFIGRDPDRRVITVSYGSSLAQKFGRLNKEKVFTYGKDIFGITLDRSNASNTNWGIHGHRGGMISTGINSAVTGEGADLLLVDDPIRNRTDSLSPVYKERLWNEWTNTLLTRLHPGGAVIIIQTRWSEDDLAGRLLENEPEEWEVVNLPAEAEEDDPLGRKPGEPLWSERGYGRKWIERTKKEVGSWTWTSLYQQKPINDKDSIIKRQWIKYYKELPGDITEQLISVDCSFKDLDTSDYVVLQVWGKQGANRYLIDQVRDQMGIVATMNSLRSLSAKYPKATTKIVEDKANGSAVIEMLRNEIPGIIPYTPKESKTARLHAVSPIFEAGNVYIPDPSKAPWVHDYVENLIKFPVARYDDEIDSTSQALIRWQQTPRIFIGRA